MCVAADMAQIVIDVAEEREAFYRARLEAVREYYAWLHDVESEEVKEKA